MDNLDVFESVFKRAVRDPYKYARPDFSRVLMLTDASYSQASQTTQEWLSDHPLFSNAEFQKIESATYNQWIEIEPTIQKIDPSLIVTHRLLKEPPETSKHSLGAYLDTLAQATDCPILIIPNSREEQGSMKIPDLKSVIAVADHLSGHGGLVSNAAAFTADGGTLTLCHLEDEDTFSYYMDAIERIPEINSTVAREKIQRQLLAKPRQYIETVTAVLKTDLPNISIDSVIEFGHLIDRYRQAIAKRQAGLLVFESKDDTQLAMHSVGYSLAIEFTETPLLLI
ncbi:MAG: hypothetical protein COB53_05415 [Elusimicrobia bacterium]|nr:MAG: hypothetical protein COB53_05415 [Elusimicrobiota bacterium]